jgi:hypothetical protein
MAVLRERDRMDGRSRYRVEETLPAALHPFFLRKRLKGPRRTTLRSFLSLPRGNHEFRLRVSSWSQTPPPVPQQVYEAPFRADELQLARRLARELRVRWVEDPLVGLPYQLARRARGLRAAQWGGRHEVVAWLLDVGALPKFCRSAVSDNASVTGGGPAPSTLPGTSELGSSRSWRWRSGRFRPGWWTSETPQRRQSSARLHDAAR